MNRLFIIFFVVLTVSACEIYEQDDYQEFVVVESYQVAGRNLQQVRLSTTLPAFEFYSFQKAAISDATVEIRLLSENTDQVETVFPYTNTAPGIYHSEIDHEVLGLRTYELRISVPGRADEITARTLVPEAFQVIAGIRDSIVYQASEQLEVTFSESNYPGRQNIYVFNTIAEDTTIENLTPFYAEFFDEEENELRDFSNTSSGLINEANFGRNEDGTITVAYPWIAVAFYGNNQIVASTIDDNLFDYIRSESVQLGGSLFSPGEIPNVITNVENGIGVFGSAASDTIRTFIQRSPFFK